LTLEVKWLAIKSYQLADFVECILDLIEDPSPRKARKTVVCFKKIMSHV